MPGPLTRIHLLAVVLMPLMLLASPVCSAAMPAVLDDEAAAQKRELESLERERAVLRQQQPTPPRQSGGGGFNNDQSPLFSLSFGGGTVEDYVKAIRKALQEQSNQDANVILRAGAGELNVPQVTLRNVTPEAALRVLHDQSQTVSGGLMRLRFDVIHGGGLPIYVLEAQSLKGRSTQEPIVHVWNVSQLQASEMKADDMLTAIETALALVQSADAEAEIRFHEATGLLIARGTGDQVATMDQVIEQLKETAGRRGAMRETEQRLRRAEQVELEVAAQREQFRRSQEELTQLQRERESLVRETMSMHDRLEDMERERQAMAREHEVKMMQMQTEANQRIAELELELQKMRQNAKPEKPSGE